MISDLRVSPKVLEHVLYTCDSYSVENIEHLVVQCPFFESTRVDLYTELDLLDPIFMQNLRVNLSKSLFWMLGGQIGGLSFDEVIKFWIVSGKYINSMYTISVSQGLVQVSLAHVSRASTLVWSV